jgi:flagellar basal-body rod modification protein FlgD
VSNVSPTSSPFQRSVSTRGEANDLREVDMDQFLQLLIAELQQQDPLDPMDNSQILEQIGQIRQISATNQLSDTLASVLSGQQMSTASSLIGKRVSALTDAATSIEGMVDRVSIAQDENDETQRILRVHVGDNKIRLENIREIVG